MRLKPKVWVTDDEWLEPPVNPTSISVHEPDEDDFTGLYDAQGNPLYRQREPIGFRVKR